MVVDVETRTGGDKLGGCDANTGADVAAARVAAALDVGTTENEADATILLLRNVVGGNEADSALGTKVLEKD